MGGDGSKPGHGSIYSKMNRTIERKTECVHVGILKKRPTETRDMQSKGDGDGGQGFQSPVGPEEPGGMQQHMREQKCNSESHNNAKEINTERLTKGMHRCRKSQRQAEPQKDLQTPQYTKRWRQDTQMIKWKTYRQTR